VAASRTDGPARRSVTAISTTATPGKRLEANVAVLDDGSVVSPMIKDVIIRNNEAALLPTEGRPGTAC
jgi:hypothetical protein